MLEPLVVPKCMICVVLYALIKVAFLPHIAEYNVKFNTPMAYIQQYGFQKPVNSLTFTIHYQL